MGQPYRSAACGIGFHELCKDDRKHCGCFCHKPWWKAARAVVQRLQKPMPARRRTARTDLQESA